MQDWRILEYHRRRGVALYRVLPVPLCYTIGALPYRKPRSLGKDGVNGSAYFIHQK